MAEADAAALDFASPACTVPERDVVLAATGAGSAGGGVEDGGDADEGDPLLGCLGLPPTPVPSL